MPTIDWSQVSAQILKTTYDPVTKNLIVEFRTGRYLYKDVSNDTYERLRIATSIGKFINTDIKPHHQYVKL